MTTQELEELVSRLTTELGAQRKLYESTLRALKREVRELKKNNAQQKAEAPACEEAPEPDISEPEEACEPLSPLQRLAEFVKSVPDDSRGKNPLFTDFVRKNDIDNLKDISEHLFRALLKRDLGEAVLERYIQQNIPGRAFMRIVRYYDNAMDDEDAEPVITDELRAEAEAAEKADREKALELHPTAGPFRLRGRQELERFLNEQVVDVINNHACYRALGFDFPKPFILEGAPGCGKTFAIDRLAEHLGWHTVHITSSSVGSSFIHDTAKKIEERFAEASKMAPALLVVDEMEAFMPDRSTVGPHNTHSTEEVGSFLKTIQTAAENHVLVVGMTNHIKAVDPAILRTGRMGTHIKVDMPSLTEVEDVLAYALEKRPHAAFPLTPFAERLLNRPLSDVTFTVDEAAMAAARDRRSRVEAADMEDALARLLAREDAQQNRRSIGFAA